MPGFDLPKDFNQLVQDKYTKAVASGDVVFTETTQQYIEDNDTQFVLSLAPSLAKKPTQEDDPEQEKRPKDFNPFLNPDEPSTVLKDYANGELNILLNKYPITANHLLLTTTKFKPQTSPLSPTELIGSLTVLKELESKSSKGEKFFAFYNCGENAGASQPHKHLQILKYPDNFTPFPAEIAASEEAYISTSKREPLQSKNLPFAHYVLPLPRDERLFDEDYITMAFASLLQRTLTVLRDAGKPVAYNVIFTRKWMMLVPRSNGYYKEKLGINSAGFTGLLLAKNEQLRDLILEDGALNILKEVAFPNTADQPTDEYHY